MEISILMTHKSQHKIGLTEVRSNIITTLNSSQFATKQFLCNRSHYRERIVAVEKLQKATFIVYYLTIIAHKKLNTIFFFNAFPNKRYVS